MSSYLHASGAISPVDLLMVWRERAVRLQSSSLVLLTSFAAFEFITYLTFHLLFFAERSVVSNIFIFTVYLKRNSKSARRFGQDLIFLCRQFLRSPNASQELAVKIKYQTADYIYTTFGSLDAGVCI